MDDKSWIKTMEHLETIRLFSSLHVKKARKGALTSAQEMDALFRITLAQEPISPLALSHDMGTSKPIVSRLIEGLAKKDFIQKQYDKADKRSYSLVVTPTGRKELDSICYYYMEPIYELERNLGSSSFQNLMALISKSNTLAMEKK